MVGWHHRLTEHEFEQALGVGDGQGSLVCFCPRGRKESDTTELLNRADLLRGQVLEVRYNHTSKMYFITTRIFKYTVYVLSAL